MDSAEARIRQTTIEGGRAGLVGATWRAFCDDAGRIRSPLVPLLLAAAAGTSGALLAFGDLRAAKPATRHATALHVRKVGPTLPRTIALHGIVQSYNPGTGMVTVVVGGERYRAYAPGNPIVMLPCGRSSPVRPGQPVVVSVIAYLSGTLSTSSFRGEPLARSGCTASAKP